MMIIIGSRFVHFGNIADIYREKLCPARTTGLFLRVQPLIAATISAGDTCAGFAMGWLLMTHRRLPSARSESGESPRLRRKKPLKSGVSFCPWKKLTRPSRSGKKVCEIFHDF
jgi:hypothetical protein